MFKRIFFLILLLFLMTSALTACGDEEEPASFRVTSTKEDVDIRSVAKDGVVTFMIFSPKGIGDADVTLTRGKMPETIQIRLFVDGLENFELTYGDVSISASSPASGGPIIEKAQVGGSETDIDAASPYWLDIQPVPAQPGGLFIGKPMLPASFLITLPADFHQSSATQFSLSWIDFYR